MEQLTELKIKALKPQDKEYSLREKNGFVLRVRPDGSKTFNHIYEFQKKRYRVVLGSYPAISLSEARKRHSANVMLLRDGINPKPEKEELKESAIQTTPEIFTVKSLISLYIDHSRKNKTEKTALEDKRILEKHILPAFGPLPASELRRRDAIKLIDKLSETAPGTARATMKISRAMFTWAIDLEYVETNPFSGISRTVSAVRATERDRVLSDDEIKYVWSVLSDPEADPRSEFTRRALMLILITGQRPGECSGLLFKEVQFGEGKFLCNSCYRCGWWTIPPDRSKNDIANDVFLHPLAMQIIGKPFNPKYTGSVFVGVNDDMRSLDRAALSHYVRKNKAFNGMNFTPHDLRRTAATGLSKLGCMDEVVDAILNHEKKGVIRIYNRNKYLDEKREWLSKWSEYLIDLVK